MAGTAHAGGVERANQGIAFLFEEGTYAELGFGRLDPDVSGDLVALPSIKTGNMLGGENIASGAFKTDLNENIVLGFIIDQPVGATVRYPTGTNHPFAGSTADLESTALTGYLRYKFGNGFSAIGGLRAQRVEGNVSLPSIPGYSLSTNNDLEYGYSFGVAYERPDIALRVSLMYNSEIEHSFEGVETIFNPLAGGIVSIPGEFDTKIPQSVTLDFQTGVAADTLVFGSIRWVDWSEFEINPDVYSQAVLAGNPFGITYPLASYQSDSITYRLGVGRRFSENWSGAFSVVYEPDVGDIFGNLGPVDGRTGVGLGVTYSQEKMKISAGVEYSWLGDAISQSPVGQPGDPVSDFQDNTSISYGIRVGYYF